ncbi:DUF2625 domain-containing protein [uncultured Arcticibacterium sp.]|uniref:DUF2625 domain-containing protein n=1 Tax=uncultured Arcticibacterium sp. TaxID=2173042 RepID=UPI0030F732C6
MKYITLLVLFVICQTAIGQMKPLEELIDTEDPGWALVVPWLSDAKNEIEVLERDSSQASLALYRTQVSTHSLMGGVIYETGGILVDKGWLRILGSGSEKLQRNLPEWNKGKSFQEYGEGMTYVLIADDAAGGFYAMNGGEFGQEDLGKIFYFAPDHLKWESLGIGYSEFIFWAFTGDVTDFYKGLKWNDWEEEIKSMGADKSMSFTPFLWSEFTDLEKLERKPVSVEEIWGIQMKVKKALLSTEKE